MDEREMVALLQETNRENGNCFPADHDALKNPMKEDHVADTMKELNGELSDCAPNLMQLLYAQFISYVVALEANARVSVFMGAGCGKSRLASVIAWHLLLGQRASYVTFVYPTAYLKKRE